MKEKIHLLFSNISMAITGTEEVVGVKYIIDNINKDMFYLGFFFVVFFALAIYSLYKLFSILFSIEK